MTEVTELPDALTGDKAIELVKADPASVLLNPDRWQRFFAAISETLRKEPTDLSTKAGRAAVASRAHSVTRTKTAIDAAAKKMKSEINERQKGIYDQLDKLAIETRAPLTAWEEAEDARKAKCKDIIERILRMAKIEWNDTSDGVINRLCEVETVELDALTFGDELAQAQETQRQAVETMTAAITRLETEEAEKAELQRLRDEAAERQRLADLQAENDAEAERQRLAALAQPEPEVEETVAPAPTTSEASIAAAAMPGHGVNAGPAPSSRQSTASEAPESAEQAAHRATIAALIDFSGLNRGQAFRVLDDITAGRIPHVTFSAE